MTDQRVDAKEAQLRALLAEARATIAELQAERARGETLIARRISEEVESRVQAAFDKELSDLKEAFDDLRQMSGEGVRDMAREVIDHMADAALLRAGKEFAQAAGQGDATLFAWEAEAHRKARALQKARNQVRERMGLHPGHPRT